MSCGSCPRSKAASHPRSSECSAQQAPSLWEAPAQAREQKRKEKGTDTHASREGTVRPEELKGGLTYRSALASTLVASLEMVREGKLEIHQEGQYDTLFLRSCKNLTKTPIVYEEVRQGEDEARDNN